MSDLIYRKSSTFCATDGLYTYTIHRSEKGCQVAIAEVGRYAGPLIDYPPPFKTLPAAKNYIDSWCLTMRRQVS